MHAAEHKTAYHSQQNTTDDINKCYFQSKRAEEHSHRHLVHQRRSNQEGKRHSQRNTAFYKADKQGNGRAGTERSNGSENGSQYILQPVHLMCYQIVSQTFYRKISVNDSHQHTDKKQQNKNLDGIIKKEVYGYPKRRISTQSEQSVNKPVCKILYHVSIVIIRLNTNKCPIIKAAAALKAVSAASESILLFIRFLKVSSHRFRWEPVLSSSLLRLPLQQESS